MLNDGNLKKKLKKKETENKKLPATTIVRPWAVRVPSLDPSVDPTVPAVLLDPVDPVAFVVGENVVSLGVR